MACSVTHCFKKIYFISIVINCVGQLACLEWKNIIESLCWDSNRINGRLCIRFSLLSMFQCFYPCICMY